jgi:hypothetical protein
MSHHVLRRTLLHMAPAGSPAGLSGFYHAEGQNTPAPPGTPPDEPELHGGALEGVGATPYSGGFSAEATLTPEEVESFKANGFLVKRGILAQRKVEAVLDRVWDVLEGAPIAGVPEALQLPPSGVSRADRASWMDAHMRWPAPDFLGTAPESGSHASTTWAAAAALRGTAYEAAEGNAQRAPSARSSIAPSWQICALGTEPCLLDLLPRDVAVRGVATQLLGPDLRSTPRVRGVYAVFPSTAPAKPLGPHTDRIAQQLNCATYLDDVPPGGAPFTVWPGSHLIMSQGHRDQANWFPTQKFRPLLEQVRRTIAPLELVGDKGDVIFWHGACCLTFAAAVDLCA